MNPRDFLDLAQRLVLEAPKAANLRTATSRAYYSAHHVGAEALSSLGFTVSTGAGGHGDVWNRLQNSGDQELTVAGSQLADLDSSRVKADYRLRDSKAENPANARGHIEQAKKIIGAIEQCCSSPKRQAILKAIKDWEASTRQ